MKIIYLAIIGAILIACSHRVEIEGPGIIQDSSVKLTVSNLEVVSQWANQQGLVWKNRSTIVTYVPDNILYSVISDSGMRFYVCHDSGYYLLYNGMSAPITDMQFKDFVALLTRRKG